MSLTTDKNDPRLGHGTDDKPVPQNEVYLVLSEEERAKGFVRPVRNSYIHVGKKIEIKGKLKYLSKKQKEKYPEYVAIEDIVIDGKVLGGKYITQSEINNNGKRIGGCGARTVMNNTIAETYARNPNFYGSTYCTNCQRHIDVEEFVWDGTDKTVGS